MKTYKQECIPVGCLPPTLYRTGGLSPGGGLCPGGSQSGGSSIRETPSPVNRMTDKCKNTTLPQTSFAGDNNAIVLQSFNWAATLAVRGRF